MKTLITGGAGFIGSHIQDKLIELGHQVAIVDNLRSGKKENIHPESQFFQVDICDTQALNESFKKVKPQAVFHLAAQNEVPYSMDHPYEDQHTNIVGMMNILEAARTHNVTKIIYSNTGGAFYGQVPDEKLPINEDEQVLKPTSFYGVSKLAAEFYLKLYANLYNITYVSLRYSNVYGPRQAGNNEAGVIAVFTSQLLNKKQPTINGNGQNTRDYVYVRDVADANIKALTFQNSDYFNISTGTEISNTNLFNLLESEIKTGFLPHHGPPRPGDIIRSSLSPKKAKEILNWEPKTKLEEGIKQTIDFYRTRKNNNKNSK